jgi:hypothetical protein
LLRPSHRLGQVADSPAPRLPRRADATPDRLRVGHVAALEARIGVQDSLLTETRLTVELLRAEAKDARKAGEIQVPSCSGRSAVAQPSITPAKSVSKATARRP